MATLPDWLRGFWRSVRTRLTSLWGRILTVFSLGTVLTWIIDHATGDTLFAAGKKFVTETLPEWARQPIGEFWLAAFGLLFAWAAIWIAFVLVMAWRDNRPAKVAKPLPPTQAEVDEVQPLREVWNRYGRTSFQSLEDLFRAVTDGLKNAPSRYWAPLLDVKRTRLEVSITDMDQAVSSLRLGEAKAVFDESYNAYVQVCHWLYRINKHENSLVEENHVPKLARWRAQHTTFYDKLLGLAEHPLYGGLRIQPSFDGDEGYWKFMVAAGHTPD